MFPDPPADHHPGHLWTWLSAKPLSPRPITFQVSRDRVVEFSAGFDSLLQPDYANKTYQLGLVEALRVCLSPSHSGRDGAV